MYEVYITADQVLILEHPVRSPSILSFSICQKIYQETFQGEVKGYFARSLLLLCVSVKIVCVNSTNERLTSQIKYWPTLFPPTSPCSFPSYPPSPLNNSSTIPNTTLYCQTFLLEIQQYKVINSLVE